MTISVEIMTCKSNEPWIVNGINYLHRWGCISSLKNFEIQPSLLQNGKELTQGELADIPEKVGQLGFFAPDAPLLYAILKNLSLQGMDNSQVTKMHNFLSKSFSERGLITSTRVIYHPSGEIISHNHESPHEYQVKSRVIGPDEWVAKTTNIRPYHDILGTTDCPTEINDVFRWLNGTNLHISRIPEKVNNLDGRVVSFHTYPKERITYLYCLCGPRARFPSLSIRQLED